MRKLNGTDLFKFTRMVQRLDIKDKVKEFALNAQEKYKKSAESDDESVKTQSFVNSVGFDILYDLFGLFTSDQAEKEIFEFFAEPMGLASGKEAAELPLGTLFKNIYEVVDVPTFQLFLAHVAR